MRFTLNNGNISPVFGTATVRAGKDGNYIMPNKHDFDDKTKISEVKIWCDAGYDTTCIQLLDAQSKEILLIGDKVEGQR